MTEYWVSSKKHYCDICNCWMSGHKMNIRNHEKSSKHLQNLKKTMSEAVKRREEKTKEQNLIMQEIDKLNKIGETYLTQLEGKEDTEKKEQRNQTIHKLYNGNYYNNNNIYRDPSNNINNNWIIMIDEYKQCVVFYNTWNHEITYEQPTEYIGYVPEKQPFSESNGWYKCYDSNTRNFYFYNMHNGQSIWQYSSNYVNSNSTSIKNTDWKQIMIQPNQRTSCNENASSQEKEKEPTYHFNEIESKSCNDTKNQNHVENDVLPTASISEVIQKKKITEIEKDTAKHENTQKKPEKSEGASNNKINISLERIKKVKKSRWDQRNFLKEEITNEVVDVPSTKEQKEKNVQNTIQIENDTHNNIKDSCEESKNENNNGYNNNTDYNNNNNNIPLLGKWKVVEEEDKNVDHISNERIEEIFYNIKSKEQLEKEKIQNLEKYIKEEYSMCNEFYVKKKEMEHEDLYMSQEFKFVDKPVYRKSIDKNLQKKKIEFAKRTIKPKNKKNVLS